MASEMMTKWERLRRRIKYELGIELEDEFVRTYAGYWQKSRGAWIWESKICGTPVSVGSIWPMTELVKAKILTTYSRPGPDIEIIPENSPQP